jgi:hypothetical protein
MLPAATDILQTTLYESYAKELRKIPVKRISDTSKDLCYQLKTSRSATQVDVATDVVKMHGMWWKII